MRPIIVIILQLTVSYSQYNPLMDDPTDRGCLDHSDCTVLGYKFGCLLYKCIDYSVVTGCDEFLHCPSDKQQCIRYFGDQVELEVANDNDSLLQNLPAWL